MSAHGVKGKLRVILAAATLWCLYDYHRNIIPEHDFNDCDIPLVRMLKEYFDYETWNEINYILRKPYKKEVYEKAVQIAVRPKKAEKLKVVDAILKEMYSKQ